MASFGTHAGEVSALALHPSGDVVASVGVDKSYVLYDLTTSAVGTQVYSNSGTCLPALLWTSLIVFTSSNMCAIPS